MPGTDIIRIKNWLSALDSKYLLGAEVTWRIDDSDWEVNIWTPLCKWSERGYAMLFDASDTKNWPQPISPGAIKSWEDDEQELEWQLSGRISIFLPTGDDVVLDETEPFTIRWRNQFCFLDNTDQFRIMERLVKAKGRKVSSEAIGEALNKDDFTDDALRKAISRLNAKLKKNGLEELANRIKTSESGRYAYIESAPS